MEDLTKDRYRTGIAILSIVLDRVRAKVEADPKHLDTVFDIFDASTVLATVFDIEKEQTLADLVDYRSMSQQARVCEIAALRGGV